MSYYVLEKPRRARVARRVALAVLALAAVGVSLAVWVLQRPVVVLVDDVRMELGRETTVADLRAARAFKASAGDLIGVDGRVTRAGGGSGARVLRNGRPAADWQRLYRGDVIYSRDGADRKESIEVTEVPVAYGTQVQGSGPVVDVRRPGEPGLKRVTRGTVSGVEIATQLLVPPKDEILVRRTARPGSKLVALTFDDGPWPKWTAEVLRVLDENDVPATFFVLGRQVKRYPEMTELIAEQGHLLGSHSQTHKRFSSVKPERVRREILLSRQTIRDASGVNTPWLRPPYGAMNARAWTEARRMRARVVLWDVDPKDWDKPGARKIADRVVRHVRPGSIVLLHDGGGDRTQTVVALPHIIRRLKAKGYIFVTVEELVEAEGVSKAPAAKALASYRP